jgi:hypothetical protein
MSAGEVGVAGVQSEVARNKAKGRVGPALYSVMEPGDDIVAGVMTDRGSRPGLEFLLALTAFAVGTGGFFGLVGSWLSPGARTILGAAGFAAIITPLATFVLRRPVFLAVTQRTLICYRCRDSTGLRCDCFPGGTDRRALHWFRSRRAEVCRPLHRTRRPDKGHAAQHRAALAAGSAGGSDLAANGRSCGRCPPRRYDPCAGTQQPQLIAIRNRLTTGHSGSRLVSDNGADRPYGGTAGLVNFISCPFLCVSH